ncbi:tetratricopeptide repeat protein [Winogradskyella echinorum]|uniref:Tetratricopeptide repeat protein n=1 Tax=Winogradskyella echinorum TaxID=538189 RepID=A0ABR6Y107_9FLAO|nr:tetratricopeptide repeat protein [Winogradskyella echinorum]MBC3845960.1 tetratricopeptide repeat protein [Winogradskyella echinorum]MBC5750308.1 tetratricopeptide repeat protein [Winogradskyella echinorum]
MKLYIALITLLIGSFGIAQQVDKAQLKAKQKATNLVYKANELIDEDNYIEAEMEYRKAISEAPNKTVGAYNLAHSYFRKGSFDEALYRSQEAAKNATTKDEKHRAYHNIGNILMQNELCKEAVEAFKDALRNNPNDEETRYNYALAKECAEQQKDGGGEDDKKDEDKEEEKDKEEDQKKEDENKKEQDKKDEGDKDKKEGDKEEDENGKPKDDKKDDGKGDKEDKNQKPKPKPGQMSPQQIKNILEAMQNQEQKVQEKINAEKQKGAKIKTEKDW